MPLRVVRRFWRFLALTLSSASKLAILSLVLLNLALTGLTVATVLSDRVFGFIASIVEAVTDVSTVKNRHNARLEAERGKVARLETDLNLERGKVTGLQTNLDAERRRTTSLETDLKVTRAAATEAERKLRTEEARSTVLESERDAERKAKNALKGEVSRVDGELATERSNASAKADMHRKVAGRFRSRAQRMAGANVAAIFGEAVPVYGVGIIVAATAYELTETCLMMRDMDELAALFAGQPIDDTTDKVCGMTVPSIDEVWSTMSGAPDTVWRKAQEHLPTEVPAPPSFDWNWPSFWVPQYEGWLPE